MLGSDRIQSTRLGDADLTLWQVEDSPGRVRPGEPNPAASRLAAGYGKPPVTGPAVINGPIVPGGPFPLDVDEAEGIVTRLRG